MIDSDAKAIIRTMRDTLQDARAHVEAVREYYAVRLLEGGQEAANEVLERIDGAIAEAEEVLS